MIDGTDCVGMKSAFEFDINADIANNLNAGIILVEERSWEINRRNFLRCVYRQRFL